MPSSIHQPQSLDDLYAKAVSLAERVRSYFENAGIEDRNSLDEGCRVAFSLQRLRITTQLLMVFGSLAEARAPLRAVGPQQKDDSSNRRSGRSPLLPACLSTVGLPAKVLELSKESDTMERMILERLGTAPTVSVADLHRLIERAVGPERV